MNNQEQFYEFLRCCKEQKVRKIHLAEACLIVNPAAGDFGSVVIEFEHCSYFVTSKYLPHKSEDEYINEFCVQRIQSLADIKGEITEEDIYKTLSFEENIPTFVTEMVDEEGYFNGMEWEMENYFLFMLVDCPCIIVNASFDEGTKYLLYSHQFGDDDTPGRDGYVELFPEG